MAADQKFTGIGVVLGIVSLQDGVCTVHQENTTDKGQFSK